MKNTQSESLKTAEAIILRAFNYAEFHFECAINEDPVLAHRTALVEKYSTTLSTLASALKMVSA